VETGQITIAKLSAHVWNFVERSFDFIFTCREESTSCLFDTVCVLICMYVWVYTWSLVVS